MHAFTTQIPAQHCVVMGATMTKDAFDRYWLRLALSINSSPRIEWLTGGSLLDLTMTLCRFLGFTLPDARRIVNEASGGN